MVEVVNLVDITRVSEFKISMNHDVCLQGSTISQEMVAVEEVTASAEGWLGTGAASKRRL